MIIIPRKIFDKIKPINLIESNSSEFQNNINVIDKLKTFNIDELNNWLKRNALYVGQGSSRTSYLLADMTCLKIAHNKRGIDQNRIEYLNTTNANNSGIYKCFTEIYEADMKDFKFLRVEAATVSKPSDFPKYLKGINHVIEASIIPIAMYIFNGNFNNITQEKLDVLKDNTMYNDFSDAGNGVTSYSDDEVRNFLVSEPFARITYHISRKRYENPSEEVLGSIYEFYKNNGLDSLSGVELGTCDNWGVVWRNKRQQLIVIDAGYSKDMFYKIYS